MAWYRFSETDEAAGGGSIDQFHDHRDLPALPVVQYIEQYGHRLYGRRSHVMRLAGDVREISGVRTWPLGDTATGTCIKRWWHRSRRSATDLLSHFTWTDSR